MIQQSELITFLIGAGTATFIYLNRRRIANIPGSNWILLAYSALFAGWTITIVEGFVLPDFMNALEHVCYMASSMAAAGWCWIALIKERGIQ
ncbi:MAG: hypothetical protein RRA15_05195 [bacterium]|nr:hypothetical protein [bacterium]MDT8365870.1 hypothetical protein [bacterium]